MKKTNKALIEKGKIGEYLPKLDRRRLKFGQRGDELIDAIYNLLSIIQDPDECPVGEPRNCPECRRKFMPTSENFEYCYPCSKTPMFGRDIDFEGDHSFEPWSDEGEA